MTNELQPLTKEEREQTIVYVDDLTLLYSSFELSEFMLRYEATLQAAEERIVVLEHEIDGMEIAFSEHESLEKMYEESIQRGQKLQEALNAIQELLREREELLTTIRVLSTLTEKGDENN